MSFAAVDIGNSKVKYCLWRDDCQDAVCMPESGEFSEVVSKLDTEGVEKVGYSTTRQLSPEETSLVEEAGWWRFGSECRLPLKIGYSTPQTLGSDRLAAAVGASNLFPTEALLIADAGTALTLDVVSASGVYEGGNISVGLEMRLEALHAFTSRLPRVEFCKEKGRLGKDTPSALRLGAVWGVVNEIVGALTLAAKEYGCRRLVVTGGSCPFIWDTLMEALDASHLRGRWDMAVDFVAGLVEEGIRTAYDYNHDR